MRIEVRLFATLADYLPAAGRGEGAALELPDGATLGDVVRRLGIPDDVPRLMLVNGMDAAPDHRLESGDVVAIFPPLAGG